MKVLFRFAPLTSYACIFRMEIVYDPRCAEFGAPGRPESPRRCVETAAHLRTRYPAWTWLLAPEAEKDDLLLAHSAEHFQGLERTEDFDNDTPCYPGLNAHASRAAGAAVVAARRALEKGSKVFSLMRPPGHHATAEEAMGFCYLNSVAVAALVAQRQGARRVAVWDFDAHHGNGTEAILAEREGFLFCSVHQFPGYPGTGTRNRANCRNWVVPPHGLRDHHLKVLEDSWRCVLGFRPDLVLVSAGFDAYVKDPVASLSLELEDFGTLGSWLAQAPVPCAALLEGGYSLDLPLLVARFLQSWETGT